MADAPKPLNAKQVERLNAASTGTVIKWMSRINTWIFKASGGKLGNKFLRGAEVEGDVLGQDAVLLRILHLIHQGRAGEHRLGRNTSPDQAGSAEHLLLLDDGHLLPELRRTNRRHIATGTRTDDDDIIWARH